MKEIIIKDIVGTEFKAEDAILVKRLIKANINDKIVLNFEGINNVPCGFFANLLMDLICFKDRSSIISKLSVNNLSNIKDFNRVLRGTSLAL